MMQTVFIGLGSNLANPLQQVLQAIEKLKCLPQSTLLAQSALYLTPPWGIEDQPAFINAVVKLATTLAPHVLLDELLGIEVAQGRVRDVRYGPRTIDCDILLYGDQMLVSEHLNVPHPYLTERAFVVVPLYEIAPTLILPCGKPLADIFIKYQHEKIEKLTSIEVSA